MASFLLTTLIIVLFYQGTVTSQPGYSLTVPKDILVEIHHCVDVSCTFTIPEWYSKSSEPLYIYWFKLVWKRYYLRWINEFVLGELAVTNDLRQRPPPSNLKLIGDPKHGDCSFSVVNAQPAGWMKYYLRIDKGPGYRHEFGTLGPNPKITVTEDIKEPVIWKPPSTTWGETTNFSCMALNCCARRRPQFLWSPKLSHWNTSDWATQTSTWTWTYGSNLSFVPILANEGLTVICNLKHPDTKKRAQNDMKLEMAYSPLVRAVRICQYNQDNNTVCTCSFHSWPPPEIRWYINHQPLSKEHISANLTILSSTQGNTVTSNLYLVGYTLHSYIISCRALNPFGFTDLIILSFPARRVTIVERDELLLPAILLGTLISVLFLVAGIYCSLTSKQEE